MKKLLSLLALCMLAAMPARAAWTFANGTTAASTNPEITDGNWTVVLNSKTKVKYKSHADASVGMLDLTDVAADTGLTIASVDYQGFQLKTDLTGIILPESCTEFGEAAFYKASNLETIVLSSQTGPITKKNVFAICTPLKSVTYHGVEATNGVICLPSTVTRLANSAFQMWDGNTTITKIIAPGVTTISKYSIYKIYNLESVEFSPNFSGFDSDGAAMAFQETGKNGSFTISPSKWKSPISNLNGDDIFFGSKIAGELDWSEGTFSEVPYRIFCGDTKLDRVTLPETVTSIKKQAFVDMKKGFVLRFLGGVPTLADSEDSKWQTSFWGSSGRYRIIVDPVAYPEWISADKGFAELTDADRARSDYPSDLPTDEVLGTTTIGLTGSVNSARRHWLIKYVDHTQYPVTWKNGDAVFGTTQGEIGEAVVAPAGTPAKASTAEFDYAFLGWNTDPSATTVLDLSVLTITGAMTFHAIFSDAIRSYAVSWEMDDGSPIDVTNVDYGAVPTHADASKASTAEHSYEFMGWSTNGVDVLSPLPAVAGPLTFIAVFEEHDASTTATVSWFDEDGTTPLDPAQTTVTKGHQPTHAEPTKAPTIDTAYTFVGWVEIGGASTIIATADLPAVTADIAYKAAYTSDTRKYVITFADYDGTNLKIVELNYGTLAEGVAAEKPVDPTRAASVEYAYAFTGWAPAFANVSEDATYTATYDATPNIYTATFVDGVDDSIILGPTNYAYGAAVEAPEAPEHYGFTFSAWSPAVTTMPAENATYTALYTTNLYTITWVNGNATTTAKYHYLTPSGAIEVPAGTKTATSKMSYAFVGWSPTVEDVQSNTTYTAVFTGTLLSPMKLLYVSASNNVADAVIDIAAKVTNHTAGVTEDSASLVAKLGSSLIDGNAEIVVPSVSASIADLAHGKGYEWTLTATQTYSIYGGAMDTATLRGRTYARKSRLWFEDAAFTDGEVEPGSSSGAGAQVRLRATMSLAAILPRALTNDTNAVVGIAPYQANAGRAAAWYAWNGSAWVRLYGATPTGGSTAQILGVVDFARKVNGVVSPAVAWYVDGAQMTTADGNWEVDLVGGSQLSSFVFTGDSDAIGPLSADYDVGGGGFFLFVR